MSSRSRRLPRPQLLLPAARRERSRGARLLFAPSSGLGRRHELDGLGGPQQGTGRSDPPAARGLRLAGNLHHRNGAAFDDKVAQDGPVPDHGCIAYLEEHLSAVAGTVETRVPVKEYFAWLRLENFEWANGPEKRICLVRVDCETSARTAKASGRFYTDLTAEQRRCP